jgi:hypothetical protein
VVVVVVVGCCWLVVVGCCWLVAVVVETLNSITYLTFILISLYRHSPTISFLKIFAVHEKHTTSTTQETETQPTLAATPKMIVL